MVINGTPLEKEIKKIFETKDVFKRSYFYATIHTEVDDIPVFKLISFDLVRDPEENYTDYVRAEILLPLGVLSRKVYPFKQNLEFSLIKRAVGDPKAGSEESKIINEEQKVLYRFKMMYDERTAPMIRGSDAERMDQFSMDNSAQVKLSIQLFDRNAEPLRIKTIGGVFQNFFMEDFLRSAISQVTNKIKVDGKPILDVVDLDTRRLNKDKIADIVIPHGTHVYDLPGILQNKGPGMYSSGCSNYFCNYKGKSTWFIYPTYHTQRFKDDLYKIIFYILPNGMNLLEKTYRIEGRTIYAVVTGGSLYSEDGETGYMARGVGVRMSDARSFMKKPIIMTEEGPVAKRNRLNHEVGQKDRADNLNYGPVTQQRITLNPLKEFSEVMKRKGASFGLTWENSEFTHLYPGMPCKVVYLEEEEIKETYGVILRSHTHIRMMGDSVTSQNHAVNTMVQVFTEKLEDIQMKKRKDNYVKDNNYATILHDQLPKGNKNKL